MANVGTTRPAKIRATIASAVRLERESFECIGNDPVARMCTGRTTWRPALANQELPYGAKVCSPAGASPQSLRATRCAGRRAEVLAGAAVGAGRVAVRVAVSAVPLPAGGAPRAAVAGHHREAERSRTRQAKEDGEAAPPRRSRVAVGAGGG